jgi:GTP-binding protein HflX
MKSLNNPCLFISAESKEGVEDFKKTLYEMVKAMHQKRYPYNNLLY